MTKTKVKKFNPPHVKFMKKMPFIGLWCYKTASYFFGRIQLYQDKSDKRVGIFNLLTVFLNTNSWYTCTIYEIRTLWGNQINKQHILLIVKILWDPYSDCCVIFSHSLHVVFLKTMYINWWPFVKFIWLKYFKWTRSIISIFS